MERENFLWLLNLYNCEVGAEIGAFRGAHAELIVKFLPDLKKLYLIDDWEHCSQNPIVDKQECINRFKDDKRIIIFHNTSVQTAHDCRSFRMQNTIIQYNEKFIAEPLDFVYIDGDHRYEFVLADIVVWYHKVKKGGLVCGHDYNNCDIRKAVEEFCLVAGINYHYWGLPGTTDCDTNPASWFFEK